MKGAGGLIRRWRAKPKFFCGHAKLCGFCEGPLRGSNLEFLSFELEFSCWELKCRGLETRAGVGLGFAIAFGTTQIEWGFIIGPILLFSWRLLLLYAFGTI